MITEYGPNELRYILEHASSSLASQSLSHRRKRGSQFSSKLVAAQIRMNTMHAIPVEQLD